MTLKISQHVLESRSSPVTLFDRHFIFFYPPTASCFRIIVIV